MSEGNEPAFGGESTRDESDNGHHILTAAEIADVTRFKFREETLELPEIRGSVVLKSLSVREREDLPEPVDLSELDDKGERTKAAIRAAAEVLSVIVSEPRLTADGWADALGSWPTEAFDSVTAAYAKMVGNEEEVKAAAEQFQARN